MLYHYPTILNPYRRITSTPFPYQFVLLHIVERVDVKPVTVLDLHEVTCILYRLVSHWKSS
jgi:hypothetical protein